MKHGFVPYDWLSITNSWSAEDLIQLLERVDERGIDHHDLPAIKEVWEELQKERV